MSTGSPNVVRPRGSRELRDAGISKHVLAGPRFRRTSPGRYVPASVDDCADQRIAEAVACMPPGSALAGWAAAYVLGARTLDGQDSAKRPLPVLVSVPAPLHRLHSHNVRYVRQLLEADEVADVGGVSVVSAVRTVGDLARWAPNVTEAVVAVDILLQAGVVEPAELSAALARLDGRRGAKQARLALMLARRGARSPGETRLRLVYLLQAGGGEVLLNPRVYDLQGRFLGMPDLLDVDAGLAMEYDGADWVGSQRELGHRDRAQHREDNVREEELERAGLLVARADGADVGRFTSQLAHRLDRARMDGLQRDRGRDRWCVRHERLVIPVSGPPEPG